MNFSVESFNGKDINDDNDMQELCVYKQGCSVTFVV